MKGEEGSWWLQEIPEYFHFARVHVGDPYRVLRNPPQCFSLAPEAERRFCEFCYEIYILHAIPGTLSRSEFIVANITFAFACTTNPACFEPSPFKTEIYPRIILAFSLNHFWRGVMLHIPATNETYKCNRVKKKRKKIEIFEIRVSFRVFLLADQLICFSIFCLKPIFWNVSAILHRCG